MVKKKLKNKIEVSEVRQSKESIHVGVGGVISQNNKWLMMKRGSSASKEAGKWEFPGNKINAGEKLADSIIRIMKDQYNLEVEVGGLVGIFEGQIEGNYWLSPQYSLKITKGTPQIMDQDSCEGFGWFSKEEALNLPLSEITTAVIEML
jgi:ADP-ribose pyrophosphatase YjhB (NUDIX family)